MAVKKTIGVLSGALATAAVGVSLAACSSGSSPSVPAHSATASVSCLEVLHQVHAVIGPGWQRSGPDGTAPDASQATGQTADGTQVDCYATYEAPADHAFPDGVQGNGYYLVVTGATSPSVIAAEVGGYVL